MLLLKIVEVAMALSTRSTLQEEQLKPQELLHATAIYGTAVVRYALTLILLLSTVE